MTVTFNAGYPYASCCSGLDTPSNTVGTTIFYISDDKVNSHAYSASTAGFTTRIIIGSDNDLECSIVNFAVGNRPATDTCENWDSTYTTLGSLDDVGDAHVGNEQAYLRKICCRHKNLQVGDPCGAGSVQTCNSGSYCSNVSKTGGTIASPHCCSIGNYWDNPSKKCIHFTVCNPGSCNFDILTNPVGWFTSPNCANPSSAPYSEGCCLVTWFGQPEYAMAGIVVNGRT